MRTAAFRSSVIQLLIKSCGLDLAEELAAEVGSRKVLELIDRLRREDASVQRPAS